ncbi:MAG TPA: CopG family transcriptional regulator [Leptospiraceae bacterium]|nr:CopG family transcriptional regulator [Leptospiraceae bacterium]HMW07790.1 CopG family transcriptional regulator [Leptospiraceae bacterium]HMX35395.1 CopG family transcriptional regulator [Leptospiraceae bacterium]HMY34166.1 CopG family transcriptional regulator [Leptospiraceae bacterium]HMZ64067.1 CopG family transcriptional regulator [Leptospiraceae bacterium]
MKKADKKFQMLFTEDELSNLKEEAAKRKLTMSEYIRMCIKNDLTKKTSYSKIMALHTLKNLNSTT